MLVAYSVLSATAGSIAMARRAGTHAATIAGEPAVIVDYTVKVPERPHTYSAREVYFVHNSHLFVCTFIGLPESMAVFEAILASIEFPN